MSLASRMQELAASGGSMVCYHRTRSTKTAREIIMAGINVGYGGWYGDGFYMTQDVKSQLSPRMVSLYGRYIVQCKVDTRNYLNCDKGTDSINAQLKAVGLNPKKWLDNFGQLDGLDLSPGEYTKYSSYSALCCVETYEGRLRKKFSGIIYTGKRDGKCCMGWDVSTIKPFGIAYVPTSKSPVRFTKIDNDAPTGFADMVPAMLRGVTKAAAKNRNPELEKYALSDPIRFGMQLCVKKPDIRKPADVRKIVDDTLEALQMEDAARGFTTVVRKCLLMVFAQSFLRFYTNLVDTNETDIKWKILGIVNYSLPLNFGVHRSPHSALLTSILEVGKRTNQSKQARALVNVIQALK